MIEAHLFPFRSRFFVCGDHKMHYIDEGSGEPVILVHGNPTWSFFYRTTIQSLCSFCRVIAQDHIGMGKSDKPSSGYNFTLAQRTADFSAFIDHLQLKEKVTLVVHDWGGAIALTWAVEHPEFVKKIIVLNSASFTLPATKKLPAALRVARLPLLSFPLFRLANLFVHGTIAFGSVGKIPEAVKAAYLEPWRSWRENTAVHAFVKDIPIHEHDPAYETLAETESKLKVIRDLPMLICWGMKDFILDGAILRAWVRFFPAALVERFENAGHLILEDEPEVVNRLIVDFIRKEPAKSFLKHDDHHYKSLPRQIAQIFQLYKNKSALIVSKCRLLPFSCCYRTITYEELEEISLSISDRLRQVGVSRGMHTLLMVRPGLDLTALTVALLWIGAIPVLVDPGMGLKNLARSIEEAEPEAFIGIPKAHLARILLRWAPKTIRIKLVTGLMPMLLVKSLGRGKGCNSLQSRELIDHPAHQKAAIIFTSGNTGPAKGVVYSHGNFSAIFQLLQKTYNLEPHDCDLATFPPFSLFSPGFGITSVIPHMDATRPAKANPAWLYRCIVDNSSTMMFGSPAVLELLGLFCRKKSLKLPSLNKVISAGAPANLTSLHRFSVALHEEAQIFTPYGATEALPLTSIGSNELFEETASLTSQGAGVCVGRPLPGIKLAVISITSEPLSVWSEVKILPPGQIGEIVVSGPVVTAEYYNRPDLTELAKIKDNENFYHRMGDLGYFDQQGRLWMCGRVKHRVSAGGITYNPIPCEAIFNQHTLVKRSALVGVKIQNVLEAVICIERTAEGRSYNKGLLTAELLTLAAEHQHTVGLKRFIFCKTLPVDIRHNSKILREKLALKLEGKIR
jgi:olefin beta-lactone synthetase